MSFVYEGVTYGSKSDVIRAYYDKGFLTMEPSSKKQMAENLGVSVPTVHATLVKYIADSKKGIKLQRTAEVDVVEEDVVEKPVNRKGMIAITYAPNDWGLPVINPPIWIDPKREKKIKNNNEEFNLF